MECREGWNPPLYGVYAVTVVWAYRASVRVYPAVTVFCCLFRVALGLCVYAVLPLRLSFVMSPLFWCLSVITGRHASSDWSPGPMLVGDRLGAYMRREWVVSGLCFLVLLFLCFFLISGSLLYFITTDTASNAVLPVCATRTFGAQVHDATVSRRPNSSRLSDSHASITNRVPHSGSDFNKTYFGSHYY